MALNNKEHYSYWISNYKMSDAYSTSYTAGAESQTKSADVTVLFYTPERIIGNQSYYFDVSDPSEPKVINQ